MSSTTTEHSTAATDRSTARRADRRTAPGGVSAGLLVLRLGLGVVFLAHGAQKVFEAGLDGTAASFAGMGIPFAEILGPVVALLELVGGALLILGLATRAIALALAVDMIVAALLVHLAAGFFAADGGYELTLVLATGALALVLAGPGRFALDVVFRRR